LSFDKSRRALERSAYAVSVGRACSRYGQKLALSSVHRSWSHRARMPTGTARSRVTLIALCWIVGRDGVVAAMSKLSGDWRRTYCQMI